MTSKIKHLQGIRGLAILAVVLFHFMPTKVANGFLGVDIFFVLSSYLMTMLMSREKELNWAVVANFWYRRAKRLLPLYYLIIFITTAPLLFISIPALPAVLDSMTSSIVFTTNFLPISAYEYFFKLSAFVDPYLHTWSLCVEIEFYLLFPLLCFLHQNVPGPLKQYNLTWIVPGIASLIFYLLGKGTQLYRSVVGRLWQFIIGILTFQLSEGEKPPANSESSTWLGLAMISAILFLPFTADQDLTRLILTLATPLLITFGKDNQFLINPVTTFLGEISYAWYLIHWPLLTYQNFLGLFELYYYLIFFVLSLILAVLVHYFYEKAYLKWNNYTISVTIVLLAFGCLSLFVPLSAVTPVEIAEARHLANNYSHLSKEEVIKLNRDLYNLDIPLLTSEGCQFTRGRPDFFWQGFCEFEEPYPQKGENTLMVIGNSWAANVLNVIREECEPFTKNISAYTVAGCDVLPDVVNSCKIEPKYLEEVEIVKPDILFILVRPVDLKHIDNGMLPLEDSVFAQAFRRSQLLESIVKKKIFILNPFPNIRPQITKKVNDFLKFGGNFTAQSALDKQNGVKIARMRTEELVRRCKKCELIDYLPYFSKNGKTTLFDPETFVTFFNSVQHLTLPGQEKIRPLYREICQQVHNL